MSDETYIQDIERGKLGDARGVTDALAAVKQRHTRVYRWKKLLLATGTVLADAMAADATAESFGGRIPFAGIVTKIVLTASVAVTGDAANHATVTVSKRDAAGANLTTLGTLTTDSDAPGQGSLVAFLGELFTLTNANLEVVAGGTFTWSVAKGGAGVVLPIFEIEVHVLEQ